jgi:hypothetical protein
MKNLLPKLLLFTLLSTLGASAQSVLLQPLVTFGTNGDGTLRAGDAAFLTPTNQFQRGMAYNPATGHLLVVDRSPASSANNDVYILDGETGATLGILNNGSTLSGGNAAFTLNLIGVADDGAIYVCNLTSGTSTAPQTRLYRWENEGAAQTLVFPTQSFPNDDPTGGNTNAVQRRWGDTMAVRGAGLTTQILLANRGTMAALFTPDDGTFSHFSVKTLNSDAASGALGYGLTFGGGDTFWGTAGAFTDGPLLHMAFNSVAGTATTLKAFTSPSFPGTLTPILVMPASNLLAGITMVSGADVVRLYDITDSNAPVLLDRKSFSTAANNNIFGGALALGTNGVLYALDSDNGILALRLVGGAPAALAPAFFLNPASDLAVAGGNTTMKSGADSSLPIDYQWYFFATNALANQTNAALTLTNLQASDAGSYSVVASNSLGSVTSSVAVLTVVATPPTTLLIYDPFPYAPGSSVAGQGNWFSTSTTGTGDAGNLSVPGLAESVQNRMTWSGASMSLRLTNGATTLSGPIYFSFAYRIDNLGGLGAGVAGSTVAGFVSGNTSTTFGTKINVHTNIDAEASFNLGVFKGGGETTGVYATNALSLSNTVFVVGRYVFGDAAADDTCALWVNPDPSTFGATNAPTPSAGDIGVGVADLPQIDRFFFRSSGGPSRSYADEVRVGLAWADVTPRFVAVPSLTLASNGDGTVTLGWPKTATGFNLEGALNLNAPIPWSPVTNAVVVVGNNNTVTVSATSGNQFFRLKK